MAYNNHLNLRTIELKPFEEWVIESGDFCLVLPEQGAGEFVCRSVAQSVAAGDVLAINEPADGSLVTGRSKGVVFSFFCLSVDQLALLFVGQELAFMQEILTAFKHTKLYAGGTEVATECRRLMQGIPPQVNLAHRSQLLKVAAVVIFDQLKNWRSDHCGYRRIEEHLAEVLKKLKVEEILNLSVGELAAKFSCSRRHLNRLFHEYFDMSVIGLRMEMRLLKAASLLRNPEAKVINVAEESGFNHLGRFNTSFKRRFGVSPREWREQAPHIERPLLRLVEGDSRCPLRVAGLCPWSDGDG